MVKMAVILVTAIFSGRGVNVFCFSKIMLKITQPMNELSNAKKA